MTSERAKELAREFVEEYREHALSRPIDVENTRTCYVCGAPEYAETTVDAECALLKYETVCRFGYELEATVLDVSIDDALGGQCKHVLLSSYCERHGEETRINAHSVSRHAEPTNRETWTLETPAIVKESTIHDHHVSYEPEVTIEVCDSCHGKIHHNTDFQPGLKPERTRERMGLSAEGYHVE